jgi:hypothetical protein
MGERGLGSNTQKAPDFYIRGFLDKKLWGGSLELLDSLCLPIIIDDGL